MKRNLSLKREVVAELTTDDLREIAGGQGGTQTCASCLTWVSCYITQCILRPTLGSDCIGVDTGPTTVTTTV